MRKKLSSLVKKEFTNGLTRIDRGFERDLRTAVFSQDIVFRKSMENLTEFIILEIKHDWDAFNVTLAWNARDEEMVEILAMLPEDESIDNQQRFSLYHLWDKASNRDPWYWQIVPFIDLFDSATWGRPLPEEADLMSRASEVTQDALARLETWGMPYFRSIERRLLRVPPETLPKY